MPEASGIDIICMSESEFLKRIRLRNNMANTIAKEGRPIILCEDVGYGANYYDEEVDWNDVEQKTTTPSARPTGYRPSIRLAS